MKNDKFVADVIYKSTVEQELQWRNDEANKHDVDLMDKFIAEVNMLGYDFKYEADLICRELDDKNLIPILKKYIGRFEDEGISAELLGKLIHKGYYDATELVINAYKSAKPETRHNQAVFYDNALYDIKDKRYIDVYLELLNCETDAINLPLTMLMLAKWQIEKAKPIFIKYLAANDMLKFTAIEALMLYKDSDIIPLLKPLLASSNKNIVSFVKKAISSFNTGDNTGDGSMI